MNFKIKELKTVLLKVQTPKAHRERPADIRITNRKRLLRTTNLGVILITKMKMLFQAVRIINLRIQMKMQIGLIILPAKGIN